MAINTIQFDTKVGYPLRPGDVRYVVPYGTTIVEDRFGWIRSMSSIQTDPANRITGASFDGSNAYVIADSANFGAGALAIPNAYTPV